MKQTVLDWLLEQMSKERMLPKLEDYHKAKQMEEKQAFEYFKAGQDNMEEGGKSFDQLYSNISKMETIRENGIVELSDDEIDKAASAYSAVNSINKLDLKKKYDDFIYAAKWYREQLKQRQ